MVRAPVEETASGALAEVATRGEELFASTGTAAGGTTSALAAESTTVDDGATDAAEGAVRRVMDRVRTPATVWTAPETARLSAAWAAGSDAGVIDGRLVMERVRAPVAVEAGAARVEVDGNVELAVDCSDAGVAERRSEIIRTTFDGATLSGVDEAALGSEVAAAESVELRVRRDKEIVREPRPVAAAGAGAVEPGAALI
jgi:hypothetical protein